jgi:hypothetical protein
LSSGTADSNVLKNNLITNIGYGPPTASGCNDPTNQYNPGHGTATAVEAAGSVTNLKFYHNVVYSVNAGGFDSSCFNGSGTANTNGLDVEYNFFYKTALTDHDTDAIHLFTYSCRTSTTHTVKYNYIRDWGTENNASASGSYSNVCLYNDDRVSGTVYVGNICTGTGWTALYVAHGGGNNLWQSNILDFANNPNTQTTGSGSWQFALGESPCCTGDMTGNYVENSILVSKNPTGTINTTSSSVVYSNFNVGNNLYHNYSTGTLTAGCDSSAICTAIGSNVTSDPKFQTCPANGADSWSYLLDPSSPAFNSPVSFPAQGVNDVGISWGKPGFWGPPGWHLSHVGTVPSYGPTC